MKNIFIIIVLIPFLSSSQISSGCGSSNWPSGISLNETKTFTAPDMGSGHFYNWIVTDGQLQIMGQNYNEAQIKRIENSPNTHVYVFIYKDNTIVCSDFLKVNNLGGGGGTNKSVNNIENKVVNYIYPNPLKRGEHLTIMNLDISKVVDIKVFDFQGNEIKNTAIIDNKILLDSNSKGIHFVKIYTPEGIITEKLIID